MKWIFLILIISTMVFTGYIYVEFQGLPWKKLVFMAQKNERNYLILSLQKMTYERKKFRAIPKKRYTAIIAAI
ncbi:hypothetical protein JOC93_000691 [Priestia taiwanensis]|uniref:Uncharacterized protein n=1 Tax=Priestia taiwanensis TaxID=1347902 RepID=A0A917EM15_9BACI|nr:hypothetical protein [Priestia taiwanensis]GGE59161.1 hypothetical protein GCM10007140_06900 [Priestia taiwanensis]